MKTQLLALLALLIPLSGYGQHVLKGRIVSARAYHSDYSFSATKTAMRNQELPQSVGTVTKELIAGPENPAGNRHAHPVRRPGVRLPRRF
jgi:iron complex outermembrane receptor protein